MSIQNLNVNNVTMNINITSLTGIFKTTYVYLFLFSDEILETIPARNTYRFKSLIQLSVIKDVVFNTDDDGTHHVAFFS